MPDPVEPVQTPAPAAAPVSPTPTPEPAAPAQADQVVAAAPVVEAPPTTTGADTPEPVREPTLLEKFDAEQAAAKAAAEKPAEVKVDAKPEEKPVDKPAEDKPIEPVVEPLPKVDYFAPEVGVKIPDTLKMNDAQKGEFTAALDAFRADQTPASAQKILDMGAKAMGDYAEQLRRDQWSTFNDTRKKWQTEVKADPEMGGAGYQTTMAAAATARDVLVSSHKPGTPQYDADMKAFNDFIAVTGAGDHPVFMRLMKNAARYVGEQARQTPEVKPPAPPRAPRGRGSIYTNTEFPK